MTTSYDDNATTWRELADQLTPEQVRKFDRSEQIALASRQQALQAGKPAELAEDVLGGLLNEARWEAQQNLNDKLFDLPAPV